MQASVIVPTHNRPLKLKQLLGCLRRQDLPSADYEIIVVDDNSQPAVVIERTERAAETLLVRLDESERSTARNRGAAIARGEILIFVDDDMKVDGDFVLNHLRSQKQYPGALVVGSVRLPQEALTTPFGRFRQKLEDNGLPDADGLTSQANFCTAANMSINRDWFLEIGGFDQSIVSSEDQDLALRHTTRGGRIVFLPAAKAIHCDDALDLRSYCRRSEWGSRNMIPFCERYPDLPDTVERNRVNGFLRLGREPVSQSTRKLVKRALASSPVVALLFGVACVLERIAPGSCLLDRIYRLSLGAHIFRGYRKGRRLAIGKQTEASGQRIKLAGWVLIAAGAITTIWITLPTRETVYRMDDWDYISELNTVSFGEYVFKVNQDGQFDPLSKAIYGVFLRAGNYSNLPLALFNFGVGWTSILVWFAILKKLNCWSVAGALAILAIRISFVGIVDVFWFPLQGATEIALLLFSASVYFLLDRTVAFSVWACGAALFAGSLAFGNGMVAPFTFAAAFFLSGFPSGGRVSERFSSGRDRRIAAMLSITVALVIVCSALPRLAQGRGAGFSFDLAGISGYFFWGGIINGAMSGVAPLLFRGPLHALFFILLAAGTVWIAISNESRERKFVVIALFLTQTATSLLIAATRWQRGAVHASSYRYVYMNVFLQLPLVAILIGILNERLSRAYEMHKLGALRVLRGSVLAAGVLPLLLGLSCSLKARSVLFKLESDRAQCLSAIVAGDSSAQCISTIYYHPDPELVRRVWSIVNQRRVALRGGADSLLPTIR